MGSSMKRSSADRNVEQHLIDMIGKSPVRNFGPVCQAPDLQKRITRLQVEHLDAYVKIKTAYEAYIAARRKTVQPLPDDLILRAAVVHNFDEHRAVELLRRMETRFWTLTAKQLEADLKLEICVPLPHIKTKTCQDVLYFMPARFAAKERSSSVVIGLMTYLMNAMYERYRDRRRKICIIINLQGWTFDQHFRLDVWLQLMDLWQGRTAPFRISQILMVNVTADFERAWTTIKTMGSSTFCDRIHFLEDESILSEHMSSPELSEHLPDDFRSGSVSMKSLVREFMVYRITLERLLKLNEAIQHPSCKFSPPVNRPKTTRSPAPAPEPVPETPRTAARKSENLFQSSVVNVPALPNLESPNHFRRPGVSEAPDTPAPTRRSFMSRTSSVPTLRAPSTKIDSSPIVEIDLDESESERDFTPFQKESMQFQHSSDAVVTAVQFQPAINAAVAAESDPRGKQGKYCSHEESMAKDPAPPPPRPKRGIFHRTSSVPRLMGRGGLGKSNKSSRGLQTTGSSESREARPEQPKIESIKGEETKIGASELERKGGRGSLLMNMGRKALDRFQSRRTLTSRTPSMTVLNKETDDTSPPTSRTSGLDFDYDNDNADTHRAPNSKQGRGFQMLG